MTAQSLKDRVAKRLKATGQPKRRRRDRTQAVPDKPKPEGYVFGRPTLYRPEYCKRAIEFMGQGYSCHGPGWGTGRCEGYDIRVDERSRGLFRRHKEGRAARVAALEAKLLTTSQGVGVTAAIFALKNADPDEWQDRYNTESTVNVRVERIPDHELMRIASTGRAPLLIEGEVNPDLGTELGTERKRE